MLSNMISVVTRVDQERVVQDTMILEESNNFIDELINKLKSVESRAVELIVVGVSTTDSVTPRTRGTKPYGTKIELCIHNFSQFT